jgi:phosphoserine aminotransferase
MEMSHRSKSFIDIHERAKSDLKEIMLIPDDYRIMFLQGGASSQFSMVPLNLYVNKKADYAETGSFAKKALKEAARYGEVTVIASSADKNYSYIPKLDASSFSKDADYAHITYNNTIYGTRFSSAPDTGGIPLVTDMSSCILSEPCDVSKFSLIYAGAQKNVGPAGLTIVIIKKELIGHALDITPAMFNYALHDENDSMYNTPPTFAIYFAGLVFKWAKDFGGLKALGALNREKSSLLYDCLDNSALFKPTAQKDSRSIMNITFVTGDKDKDAKFVKEATQAGLVNIKGHRSVGGMRASVYNAMPLEGVKKLVDFIKKFETENK